MLQLQALVEAACEDHAKNLQGRPGKQATGSSHPVAPHAPAQPAPLPARTCTQAMPMPTAPMTLRCSWMKVSSLVMQPPWQGACGTLKAAGPPALNRHSHSPASLPPPCRCWRRGPAPRSPPPRSCSSCRGPRGLSPGPSGPTHCPASPASCCYHSNGTAVGTQPGLSPRPQWDSHRGLGGQQGGTHCRPLLLTNLLLQLVHSAGHTLVARLVVLLGHGSLQVLLELCIQLEVRW